MPTTDSRPGWEAGKRARSLFALLLVSLVISTTAAGVDRESGRHWAFQPVRNPPLPEVADTSWPRTSIDLFILAELERAGLSPAPPADKRTFLRRVTYDLTGLPPTFEEVQAFLQDESPGAFEKVVERLLASPAYGERWGRHWLDLVRYADTAGETADFPVAEAWRYRNYVIDAFNRDKPYDEFLREQVAGDILAEAGPREKYAERVTATGFIALSRRFGFDSENYHHLTIQDTIDTLGQAVLGLTLGCARCHDHKYDPVPMKDYYALYGIFESTRYPFPGSEQKQRVRVLAPLVPQAEARAGWKEYERRVAHLKQRLKDLNQTPPSASLHSLQGIDGDFEIQAPAAGGSRGVLVPPWVYEGEIAVTEEAQSPYRNVYPGGRVGVAMPAASGRAGFFQTVRLPTTAEGPQTVHLSIDFKVVPETGNETGERRFLLGTIGSDGSRKPAVEVILSGGQVALKGSGEPRRIASLAANEWQQVQLTIHPESGEVTGSIGGLQDRTEFNGSIASGWCGALELIAVETTASDVRIAPKLFVDNIAVSPFPIAHVSTNLAADAEGTLSELDGRGSDEAAKIRKELEALLANGPFELAYAVAEGTPRDSAIHLRGEPETRGGTVPRGLLTALGSGPLPPGVAGSGRLELANWLTDPENPLTARVMVNRVWTHHFGRGLVETPNDFGVRGAPPTHPELLDHLAARFVSSGWSIKALHRLILLSATYRQAACEDAAPAELALYRGMERRRLTAEELRDSLLKVSGELDWEPGAGHPFPTPSSWGYTQHTPFTAVYDSAKRSVYLMQQRIKRHPFLALFDGADPNASVPERRTTIVPTQALFFLNDPLVHANAAALADRLTALGGTASVRVERLWQRVLARTPSQAELSEALEFLERYEEELNGLGAQSPGKTALAALARVLLGGNEFLFID